MALSPDNDKASGQIVSMYQERRMSRSGIFRRMQEVRDHYNGDVIVPLPELDEAERPAIPNLIAQGIDQFAMRVASTLPDIQYPALRNGIQVSENKANDRRLANLGWWEMNKMGTKVRRRARHLTAYGMSAVSLSPVSLDPADKRQIPFWRVRNPLATFPAPMIDPDNMEPVDCIFADRRPLGWLMENYPSQMNVLYRGEKTSTDMFEILEYLDANETVLVAVGAEKQKATPFSPDPGRGMASHVILERIPNRAEVCPVVIAGRITLDRLQGQFDQMLGMYQREAKLDALNTIAVFRNVFPDEWVVSPAGAPTSPRIIQEADGKQGIRGVLDKGQIQTIHTQQTQDVGLSLDRLERAQRLTAGVPQEFGGESGTNIRTASRGASVLSSAVDMPLQEYQEIMANSMEVENSRAVKIMKSYYGKKPSMFFFGSDGKITRPDYTPDDTFETDVCNVTYSMPGSDINSMVVSIGQRVGMGIMSNETARTMDPAIKDPLREADQVEIEGLRKALLTGLEQQAAQGALDPSIIARIAQAKAQRHVTLEDAVAKIHQEMQEQQAEQAQQQQQAQQQEQPQVPGPEMQPGMGVSPENPVQGAPAGAQQPNLEQLLSQLHTGGAQMAPAIAQAPAQPAPGV
jgi:hypothetical protein